MKKKELANYCAQCKSYRATTIVVDIPKHLLVDNI